MNMHGFNIPQNIHWFEALDKIVKRMRLGYQIGIGIMLAVIIIAPLAYFKDIFKINEMLSILVVYPLWLWFLRLLIRGYRELNNKAGTDGRLIYLVDYEGKLWIGNPSELIFDGKSIKGGRISVVLKGKYTPLYKKEDFEFLTSNARKVYGLVNALSYNWRYGSLFDRFIIIYFPVAMFLLVYLTLRYS